MVQMLYSRPHPLRGHTHLGQSEHWSVSEQILTVTVNNATLLWPQRVLKKRKVLEGKWFVELFGVSQNRFTANGIPARRIHAYTVWHHTSAAAEILLYNGNSRVCVCGYKCVLYMSLLEGCIRRSCDYKWSFLSRRPRSLGRSPPPSKAFPAGHQTTRKSGDPNDWSTCEHEGVCQVFPTAL